MGDFISRESAIRALEFKCKILTARGGKTAADILARYGIGALKSISLRAADVIPVVRCKDCDFGEDATYGDGSKCVVCWNDYVSPSSRIRDPEWFCAEGTRRKPGMDD